MRRPVHCTIVRDEVTPRWKVSLFVDGVFTRAVWLRSWHRAVRLADAVARRRHEMHMLRHEHAIRLQQIADEIDDLANRATQVDRRERAQ